MVFEGDGDGNCEEGKRGCEVLNIKDVRRSHAEFCNYFQDDVLCTRYRTSFRVIKRA